MSARKPEWRCQSCGVCFPRPSPPPLRPAHVIPLGCSHLWLLMLKRCFAPNTLALEPDTGEQKRLPVSADRQPAGPINRARERSMLLCPPHSVSITFLLWMFSPLPQCGCLAVAVKAGVYEDAPATGHFFVCSLFVSVKDAAGSRLGPGVGKVG